MENSMKDYMVAHKFKTAELRDQYFEMSKDMTADDTVSYTHLTLPTMLMV